MRSLRLRTLGLLLPGLALVPMLPAAGGAPFITDDTGTPGLGHWEFNLVAIHERCDGACSTELPMFDMSYGPTERIQLNYVVSNSIAHEDGNRQRNGLSNSLLGVKWRFLDDEKSGVSASICPQLEFRNPGSNSARRGLSADENTFVLPVELQREFSGWGIGTEIGAVFPGKSDSGWIYGVVASRGLSERLDVGVELHGEGASGLDRTELVVNVGLRCKVGDSCCILVSVGRELHNHFDPRATLVSFVAFQWTR